MGNGHEEECCSPLPYPPNEFKELMVKLEAATQIIPRVLISLAYRARIHAVVSKLLLSQGTDTHLHFASCPPVLLARVPLHSALNNHKLWETAIVRNL